MLDASGGYRQLLERVAGIYEQWRAAAVELEELERSEQEKLRLLDLWQFQRKEIESAGLEAEEEAALENERRVLQNVQRLEEAATAAYAALYGGEESAVSLARVAAKRVDELCRIDASLADLREHLKAADLSLQEASYTLRDYVSRLEANPGRLEEVETRLEAICAVEAEIRAVGGAGPRLSGGCAAADCVGGKRQRAHGRAAARAAAIGSRSSRRPRAS